MYSLRPEILVGKMDVSTHILVLDAFIFTHFHDKYFRTEGVLSNSIMPWPHADVFIHSLLSETYCPLTTCLSHI